jgi:DNA-binding SARP family transcriptional activator
VLHIRLLGRPSAELDGAPTRGPRGRKAWALLAVLLLSDGPSSRERLAALLFPDAADPLGALRWTLSQLRRGLPGALHLEGDPVVTRLAATTRVDVLEVLAGRDHPFGADGRDGAADRAAAGRLDPGEALLVGADGVAGPEFDLWLTAARHRVDQARGLRLRGLAERALASGQASLAVAASARAVAVEPHRPAGRAALVSALVEAGDHEAALAQLRECSGWIRRELRVDRLLGEPAGGRRRPADADTTCRLQTGQAAMAAGAVTGGLDHLREAVRLAAGRDDAALQATALLALGGALVHALAAHAPEGAEALRAAAGRARRAGAGRLAAEALRDLAFVENAAGRPEEARRLLSAATAAAGDDPAALGSVRGVEGMFLADRGEHGRALEALKRSARLAESAGSLRQAAWSISIASRSLLQRGELDAAAELAELAAQLAAEERWTAMLPWMEALLAELDLAAGRVDAAEARLRYGWSLSQVLGDWCWQAMTARGLGLAAFARGDLEVALRWLGEASRRAARPEDRYVWIHAWVQDAVCRVTVAAGLPRAGAEVGRLAAIASASRQPDFAVRADLHRGTLGVRASHERARAAAAALDNPGLRRMAASRA